jgi:hypothetical protein
MRCLIILISVTYITGCYLLPNDMGDGCNREVITHTNSNNLTFVSEVVNYITTHVAAPNFTIVNVINYVGNTSIHLIQSIGNTTSISNIYTSITLQTDNSALVVLGVIFIVFYVIKTLVLLTNNRCCITRKLPIAKVDPVDMAAIDVKS